MDAGDQQSKNFLKENSWRNQKLQDVIFVSLFFDISILT